MGDLVQFPNGQGPGETYGFIPPDRVLTAAKEKKLDQVIVLGWDGDEFYAASSSSHVGDAIYMLERAKELLMQR